jgi:hypothetical protein
VYTPAFGVVAGGNTQYSDENGLRGATLVIVFIKLLEVKTGQITTGRGRIYRYSTTGSAGGLQCHTG